MDELVRDYLAATHRRRPVMALRVPGRAAAVRDGAILTPQHAEGRRTWRDFLAEHVQPS